MPVLFVIWTKESGIRIGGERASQANKGFCPAENLVDIIILPLAMGIIVSPIFVNKFDCLQGFVR
ncbi:MAG: hypothetical protein ACKO0V_01785 [bacterium]